MEITPERGVPLVHVGDSRADVENRVGRPVHGPGSSPAVYETTPTLVVHYLPDDTVELVELGYSGDGGEEVTFDGVQLTYRFIGEVVAELEGRGYTCTPSDIGFEFHAGFAVWSMDSLWAGDLDPGASEDDERSIVEGVSVAPYSYFVTE
ncbi:hypothetical protein [Phytomonospora endophytica]|uniref:Uncharacterized protein n=1 Tax=Phytomonospora endophytica TaxID=714109 RepID=A0A841FP68_9ACTN|nr:hypothetical protein [Phytomonospora endophytica]MBB6035352.1 hypothetical protein [Phytomonospora endophytica]GIG63896.1 hypothetical protein Pen01_01910 [Phytomonospora endophytica]